MSAKSPGTGRSTNIPSSGLESAHVRNVHKLRVVKYLKIRNSNQFLSEKFVRQAKVPDGPSPVPPLFKLRNEMPIASK